jgi:hypothetical protein
LLEHASQIRYGLVPQLLADFLVHPSQHPSVGTTAWAGRLAEAAALCWSNVETLIQQQDLAGPQRELLVQLVEACVASSQAEHMFEEMRRGRWRRLWPLRARSWRARWKRDALRRETAQARRRFVDYMLAHGRAVTKTI